MWMQLVLCFKVHLDWSMRDIFMIFGISTLGRIFNNHVLGCFKIWENYVEGQEVANGSSVVESKQKEVLQVVVAEVLGDGKFYIQTVSN
ncbi:ribonuclease TUDOR 2-like isoform X2 [Magnolia sinica]|uniref:ribonuclease TUDOR 2-like isoform X2 n=1 Tax=Magnolia sinica TaxID=86752 RepID=UPI002658268A|nr:ribonuclease TUDOR 2-like isoform X2 [Magnolia sinica]